MSKRIGELLVEKGLITRAQLQTALKSQLIFGGHLGTCLIELGVIEEDALGLVLSEVAGVPYAPPSVLLGISPATIHALPRRLAEECQALPLKLAGRTLHLAMVHPRNVMALDEIAFATERKIVAWVAPELRIYQALERYYGVPRRMRYITICHALDQMTRERNRTARANDRERLLSTADIPVAGPLGEERMEGADDTTTGEFDPMLGYGRSWRELAEEMDLPSFMGEAGQAARGAQPASRKTLSDAAARICAAVSRSEAVDAILGFASTRFERCMVLGVDGRFASVWASRGTSLAPHATDDLLPIDSDSIFGLIVGDGYFRGPLPQDGRFSAFYSALGMEAPAEALLVPVHLDDHLVAIIYGDGGKRGTIPGETHEYNRLARVFALCLEMLRLKARIVAIAGFRSPSGHAQPAGFMPPTGS